MPILSSIEGFKIDLRIDLAKPLKELIKACENVNKERGQRIGDINIKDSSDKD